MRKLQKGLKTLLLLCCAGLSLVGNEMRVPLYIITGGTITRLNNGSGAEGLYIENFGSVGNLLFYEKRCFVSSGFNPLWLNGIW